MTNPDIDDLHLVPEDKTAIQQKLLLGARYARARDEGDEGDAIAALAEAVAKNLVPVLSADKSGRLIGFGADAEHNARELETLRDNDDVAFDSITAGMDMPFVGGYGRFTPLLKEADPIPGLLDEFGAALLDYRHGAEQKPVIRDIVSDMLALNRWGPSCTICLPEIALLHMTEAAHLNMAGIVGMDVVREAALLSADQGHFCKARLLREMLSGDASMGEPTGDYIAQCESIAAQVFGQEVLDNSIAPTIQTISRMLNATGYFGYQNLGFTQQVVRVDEKRTDAFFQNVMPEILDKIRADGGNVGIKEFNLPTLTMASVRNLFSLFSRKTTLANDPSDIRHVCGKYPLSYKVLAEIVGADFLRFLDQPEEANHNCARSASGQTFYENSPSGEPDAYAVHPGFLLTVEVSMAQSKSGPSEKDAMKTIYESDIHAAQNHINDFATEAGKADVPKFVLMATKDIPMDEASLNLILDSAADDTRPTVIPATFATFVELIDGLNRDPKEIESEELLNFLQKAEGHLIALKVALDDHQTADREYQAELEAGNNSASPPVPSDDVQALLKNDIQGACKKIIMKSMNGTMNKGKVPGLGL